MRIEDKKYVWWGLLGIGVAAFFYFLSKKDSSAASTSPIQVPYLVPSTMAAPMATDSLNNQSNIVGNNSNSPVPNGYIPSAVDVNSWQHNWSFSAPSGPHNTLVYSAFTSPTPQAINIGSLPNTQPLQQH